MGNITASHDKVGAYLRIVMIKAPHISTGIRLPHTYNVIKSTSSERNRLISTIVLHLIDFHVDTKNTEQLNPPLGDVIIVISITIIIVIHE